MAQPAARMGDTTAHGGVITSGYPQVAIGGQPAARMGDQASCVGPLDVIVTGCPTVLIGG